MSAKNLRSTIGVKYLFNRAERESNQQRRQAVKEEEKQQRRELKKMNRNTTGVRDIFKQAERQAKKDWRQHKRVRGQIRQLEKLQKREEEHQQRLRRIDQAVEEKIYKLNSSRKNYQQSVDRIFQEGEKRKRKWEEKESKRRQKQREKETVRISRKGLIKVSIVETAHYQNAVNYKIKNISNLGPEMFIDVCRRKVLDLLRRKHIPSKTNIKLQIIFIKLKPDGEIDKREEVWISANKSPIVVVNKLLEFWNQQKELILEKISEVMLQGSGWQIERVVALHIQTDKLNTAVGSSWVNLPAWIKNKGAVINMKNDD